MSTDDVTAEELVKRLRKISSLVAAELAATDDPDAPGGDMTHSLAAVRSDTRHSILDYGFARRVEYGVDSDDDGSGSDMPCGIVCLRYSSERFMTRSE